MNIIEVLITELCLKCDKRNREGAVCYINKPSWSDAYRCNWDKADKLGGDIVALFKELKR